MGYTEDVVKRVIARTGPTEASEILDVVQQEQDRSDRRQAGGEEEEEMMEEEEEEAAAGGEEDFVLGVVKKAAASCGYMEQEVAKVYGMLPERSTHRLLLELQREAAAPREAAREAEGAGASGGGAGREAELFGAAEKRKSEGPNAAASEFNKFHKLTEPQAPRRGAAPEAKGPPAAAYPSAPDLPLADVRSDYRPDRFTSKPDPPTRGRVPDPQPEPSPAVLNQAFQAPPPPAFFFARNDSSPPRARERRGFGSSVVVTGEQRFLEGLRVTFDLRLTDKPGDPTLRMVVIDGSNVAMSHGLGNFFSCRGIALAVQHFWDRGHRDISAMLPQWRQKSDPKNKEQHYLSQLQQLGLLSYTPSREVQGKRISSYDDRLMLQLAQKKDGVIVTNDNLRDLLDESIVWRDIIKKRILQYTFVGDLFMVPDDPLGRGGPHLDDFLRSDHRTPYPGNHSFAGVATMFPSSTPPPRSQTELLNFRDRTLEGALTNGAAFGGGGGSRGRGKAHAKGWGPGHLLGVRPDRTPQETSSLREQLRQVFPGQDHAVALVLRGHPAQTDMNVLSDLILEQ
ncbi:NEDD4-binding protein 1 [Liparis tanakae]|uniref:NEDD4-binding protein 1 n=1 Tax=Liparis tanakae TaxID=230148 RepID=A0A4Z2GIP4_9TELE|nr:NEDD4-binding protein 1 [Liparis tanakae]